MDEILTNSLVSSFIETVIQAVQVIYLPVAITSLAAILLWDRKNLKIKLDKVTYFIGFMVFVLFVKICLWNGTYIYTNSYGIKMYSLLFVFLEDVFFAMIPLYLCKIFPGKKTNIAIWTVFSLVFGTLHLYQGVLAGVLSSIYPFFISRRYGKKNGFGTVMVCHFLYDCFVMVIPKINNILISVI